MENLPEASVTVPPDCPTTMTTAPGTGMPEASLTWPVIVRFPEDFVRLSTTVTPTTEYLTPLLANTSSKMEVKLEFLWLTFTSPRDMLFRSAS